MSGGREWGERGLGEALARVSRRGPRAASTTLPPPRASDWTGKFTGRSPVALRPRTEAQAAAALARCAARRLAVVPQGGNTGLVGGGVPLHDEVVLSTARMVGVTRVDAAAGVVSARAGTTLAALEAAAAAAGLTIPLDLGARGTCAIGGNVATNAGGARVVRYGTLRSTVLGLDALLADGTRLDLTRPLRKDNTGYDLKQLLIGSEGTLALITGVTLAAPRATVAPALAYLACPTWAAVQDVMGLARARLGEALAAAEFVDAASVALATAHLSHVSNPFPSSAAPYFVLLEAAGVDGDHDAAKMERLVGEAFATGAAVDGVASAAGARPAALWALREGVPVALRHAGACYKYDVSLAVAEFEGLVNECQKRATAARGDAVAVGYGHLGDGNLHLNVSHPGPMDARVLAALEPWVYEAVAAARGSVSAEHGIGLAKASLLPLSKPRPAIDLMAAIKVAFDPEWVLNPYKVLPADAARAGAAGGRAGAG